MKLIKKYSVQFLTLMSLVVITTVSTAEECPFDGFYTGLSAGGSFLNGHENVEQTGTSFSSFAKTNIMFANSSRRGLVKNSLAGSVFLGYGLSRDFVYLGVEGFIKGARAKVKTHDIVRNTQLDTTGVLAPLNRRVVTDTQTKLKPWEFGVDLRPGVLLNSETLLYGRVGITWNKLSLVSTQNFTFDVQKPGPTPVTLPAFSQALSKRKHNSALRLGVGLERQVCENLTIRADYINTRYRKAHISGSTTVQDVNVRFPGDNFSRTVLNDFKIRKLATNTVMLGLSYYW